MGQAEGDGAYQTCPSCCPSPDKLSALKEEGHKVAQDYKEKVISVYNMWVWMDQSSKLSFFGYYCVEFSLG